MSVSRDFIYYYSPDGAGRRPPHGAADRYCAVITLAFGFRNRHDLGQSLVTIRQPGCFFLTLGKKSLKRLVQPDGLIDFRAGSGPICPSRMSSSISAYVAMTC